MQDFLRELRTQRWDDHRYYHQSRINQSLHFISAIGFVIAYAMLFVDPATAAWIGWAFSMSTRQAGHFFFEPKGYDLVNDASFEHKEAVKVGYNLQRKVVLMGVWIAAPVLLALQPSLFGLIEPGAGVAGWYHDVGIAWLSLGVAGLVFRVLQLTFTQGAFTGVVWASKILTDPFHDIVLYHRAPLALLRGERLDPMTHVRGGTHR